MLLALGQKTKSPVVAALSSVSGSIVMGVSSVSSSMCDRFSKLRLLCDDSTSIKQNNREPRSRKLGENFARGDVYYGFERSD
jgi:hypothetical protein